MPGRQGILFVTVLLLLGAAPAPVRAQGELPAQGQLPGATPVVLVTLWRQSSPQSESLDRVLRQAVGLEAANAGLRAVEFQPPRAGAQPAAGGALSGEELRRARSATEADFLLLGRYVQEGRDISVTLELYDLENARRLGGEAAVGRVDLSLDETVGAAVAALLGRSQARIAEVARGRAERRRAAELALSAAEEEARRQRGPAVAFGEGGPGGLPAGRPFQAPRGGSERERPLELTLGFQPFVPVGEPASYLSAGYSPLVGLLYRFDLPLGALAVGVQGGMTYLSPVQADDARYFRWLLPLGVQLRYSVPESRPFRLYVQASGGAAYRLPDSLAEQSGVSERLTRVLPYAGGGIGMLVSLAARLGLAVEGTYQAYFYLYAEEPSSGAVRLEVVSGLTPSMYLYWLL